MKLHESQEHSVVIFHLEDDVDLHSAPTLRARFHTKAKQRCPALVVDLSRVPFIDSTGIAVLLEYLRDATGFGGRFCLAAPTGHVAHVFEIVRLNRSIPVFDNTREAVLAMASNTVPLPVEPLFSATTSTTTERLTMSRAA
jgi:anti-sigma B factor antagonist